MRARTERLGASISLADFLALPPDGERYDRDEKGRLVPMSPDDALRHRRPLARLTRHLLAALAPERHEVVQEPPVAFDPIRTLDGSLLPPSRHGPKVIVPDVACFAAPARIVRAPAGHTWYAPEGVLLVVELLSPKTWRSDLGRGSSPQRVDRWRTYLEGRVAEYWLVNAGYERCGLPPRSALVLANDTERDAWTELPVESARQGPPDPRGFRPLLGGVVRSRALPGLVVDLAALWRD